MSNYKWEKTPSNNVILKADWGYISYNPSTGISHQLAGMATELLNILGEGVKDGEETALYHKKSEVWRILTGDFRKEYEKVFPDFKVCLEVYKKNEKFRNNYSTDKT